MNLRMLQTEFDLLEEQTFDLMKSQILATQEHPAWAPEHQKLNRFANITPCRHTLLEPYMNANVVTIRDFTAIAAQCPLPIENATLYNLFFGHIETIIMLCNVEEGKVDQYYPEPGAEMQIDRYRVRCPEAELISEDLVLRRLEISCDEGTKTVRHYQLTSWPDLACPQNAESFALLLHLTPAENSFIHCSAGVGRTGSFILCRSLLDAQNVSIKVINETILQIRRQRSCFMVQSFEQYRFCCEFLTRSAY